ncbi:hypothetical protein HPB48_010501 [Haemaphysalis longicornis]|uniref:Gustatory receptor n=1 Tax=Haemaphysalis longicornis TaxID=44386 RepID=A0A9J6FCZ8_HAELO|nr:hypothetical protein HPB48_010501 [Haemaphysalis longicornis]
MQRKRWLAVGFVALYGVAMAIQQCVWLLAYGPVAYFRSQVYGLDPVALRLPSILVVLVAILDFTAYNLSVLVPAACIVHYVGICDLMVLKGERFRSALQCCSALGSDGLKAASVRKLQASYSALLEAVQYLDERLRSAIFFWYVDTVLNIVVSVRSVQHTLAHFNPYAAAGAYVHGAYLVTAFLLVSLSAANLVAQRRHIYRDMCRLVCGIGADDDNLCNQVMLLQEDISNGELAFTGWNCFVIDRPFILSVTGAVITYAVVLQQLT